LKRLVSRLKFWKSNRNQVRKESIIENDINQLDEKEISPNASYLRGHFGTNLFIAKVNNSEVLAPLYHFNEELSIANELISGTLKKENLVTIFKAIIERENVSIIMDNYSKTGTQLIMKSGPQSESVAKQIIQQILRALKYLHSNEIAHRNITLDNIYIIENGDKFKAKLADLITAVQCIKFGKSIKDKTWIGTDEYMSPKTLK
jgi:serine/threonine protein kinase